MNFLGTIVGNFEYLADFENFVTIFPEFLPLQKSYANVARDKFEVRVLFGAKGVYDVTWFKGKKQSEGGFSKGWVKEGKWTSWNRDGVKVSEVNYKNGSRFGMARRWEDNGVLEVEIHLPEVGKFREI
jgi:antitoxin component YwqK of YwqJK toxin-antitoxin module